MFVSCLPTDFVGVIQAALSCFTQIDWETAAPGSCWEGARTRAFFFISELGELPFNLRRPGISRFLCEDSPHASPSPRRLLCCSAGILLSWCSTLPIQCGVVDWLDVIPPTLFQKYVCQEHSQRERPSSGTTWTKKRRSPSRSKLDETAHLSLSPGPSISPLASLNRSYLAAAFSSRQALCKKTPVDMYIVSDET